MLIDSLLLVVPVLGLKIFRGSTCLCPPIWTDIPGPSYEYFAHPLGRGRVGCAAPNLGAEVSQNHFGFLPTGQGLPLGHVLHGVHCGHLVAAGRGRQLGKVDQYLRLKGCLWWKAACPLLCGSAPNRPSAFGTIWPDAARTLRNGTSKTSHQGSAHHGVLRLIHKDS